MERDLDRLLSPRAVAVIGASPKAGSVGGTILQNLRNCGYQGELLPVNPNYADVQGLRCYRAIEELPDGIDLAVLAIRRSLVLGAVETCSAKGIRNLVIITAGFKESGDVGARLEEGLGRLIAEHDLQVVGPNCMGIIHSSPEMKLNASFSRWFPPGGEIAFISQSGSLGETLLECFGDAGLGVGRFINLGNRAGLSENDFLSHFLKDEQCGAIFLYLESFAAPTAFRRLLSEAGRRKPVIVLKAGRTEAGAAAVASHTGSLASPDAVVDAFLRQCGAIRVTTIEETLTALRALERGVLPSGRRVAILTNAGGGGIVAADACERTGIRVPPLGAGTRQRLEAFLPPEASLGNPVDMIATAGSADYERALEVVLAETDAAIVIFRPPLVYHEPVEAVADGILRIVSENPDKPLLVCTLSEGEAVQSLIRRLWEKRIPTYAMPETAVDALSVLMRARELKEEMGFEEGALPRDVRHAQRTVERVLAEGRDGLTFEEGADVLSAYGAAVCPFHYAASLDDARTFVESVGYPIVAKVDAPGLFHRFEQKAVITGIRNEDALGEAMDRLREIIAHLRLEKGRVLLQKTLSGRELIFGMKRDPSFGPVIMFGIGGTLVEALKDVSFGVAPISSSYAERMIRSIRAFPLLEAFRGQEAVDLAPLSRILLALGQMGLEILQIEEVDLNPVIADGRDTAVVDVLIKLRAPAV